MVGSLPVGGKRGCYQALATRWPASCNLGVAHDRRIRPDLLERRPAGAAALDVVDHIDRVALPHEMLQPAMPAVRRLFPHRAGHAAAVQQHQRQRVAALGGDEVLHVGLLDVVQPSPRRCCWWCSCAPGRSCRACTS